MSLYGALAEADRTGKEVLASEVALADGLAVVDTPFAIIDSVALCTVHTDDSGPEVPAIVHTTYRVVGHQVEIAGWVFEIDTGNVVGLELGTTGTVSFQILGRRR
jgi:hypothetical protein